MSHLSDLAIDRHLVEGTRPSHLEACSACRRRFDELAADRERFLERARPAAFAEAVLARRRPSRRWMAWLALAPALALLVVWLIPRDGVRYKGSAAVELFVRSEGRVARFDPERRYHPGDALQVVYSAARAYDFAAVDVDAAGRASILLHARVDKGAHRKLDRSFVLDEGSGDERVFLLFSEAPLDEARVIEAARTAGGSRLALPLAAQESFVIRR